MRGIKKELDEDGKPEWAVYIDEVGDGNRAHKGRQPRVLALRVRGGWGEGR